MYFRTKTVKDTALVQLVESYRNAEGHIFISALAYHLLSWVRETLRDCGDLRDWKTLRRLLSTHCLATTSLPLEDGRVLHRGGAESGASGSRFLVSSERSPLGWLLL